MDRTTTSPAGGQSSSFNTATGLPHAAVFSRAQQGSTQHGHSKDRHSMGTARTDPTRAQSGPTQHGYSGQDLHSTGTGSRPTQHGHSGQDLYSSDTARTDTARAQQGPAQHGRSKDLHGTGTARTYTARTQQGPTQHGHSKDRRYIRRSPLNNWAKDTF